MKIINAQRLERVFPLPELPLAAHILWKDVAASRAGRVLADEDLVKLRETTKRLVAAHKVKRTLERTRALAELNADIACAISAGADFPSECSIPATIFLADSAGYLAEEAIAERAYADAIELELLALKLIRAFRAFTGARNVDGAIYANAARAAEAVGRFAASKRMKIERAVASFDANITTPYAPLMTSKDLSAPRAFVAAFMLRAAARGPVSDSDRDYLSSLISTIRLIRADLEPIQLGAARAFDEMLDEDLERAQLWLDGPSSVRFDWVDEGHDV